MEFLGKTIFHVWKLQDKHFFINGNFMITIFFKKKQTLLFFITRLLYLVQIGGETRLNIFSMVF